MNDTHFRFASPQYLYALFAVVLFVLVYVYGQWRSKKKLALFADTHLLATIVPDYSPFRNAVKFSLLVLAYIFLVLALARPQYGIKLQELQSSGIEVVVALDVSNSMRATDIAPNRLERAKLSTQRLLDQQKGDKVSLIIFAGDAFVQVPMTSDISSVKMFLNAANTSLIARQGTAIGAAIRKGMSSFTASEESSKAIIVISDGENHEDDAVAAAEMAHAKGIVVHTIGMGTTQGVLIPLQGKQGYLTDKSGKPVTTRLNEEMLQEIAKAGGGVYSNTEFAPVVQALQEMQTIDFETQQFSEYDERYYVFLLFAALCLILEFVILERKNRFLQRLQIFTIKHKTIKS
ncbi:MAG: VWA domain-containing protein [Bacteroidales bacterium]|jgi:Ca-activated chloride channel family protein|nr:VWA domain-containing protein [Bacteroidales bacterium]